MGLLQKLKSALGFDGSNSPSGTTGDVDVTVEREPSTEDEDAVKGTETSPTATDGEAGSEAANGDIATESKSQDTEAGAEIPDAESDTVSTETEHETADTDAAEAEAEAEESDSEAAAEPDVAEGAADPVTEIKGIGPAYADRLADIGIDTVGDLAAADAAEVSAETDIAESRVEGWIEQATAY